MDPAMAACNYKTSTAVTSGTFRAVSLLGPTSHLSGSELSFPTIPNYLANSTMHCLLGRAAPGLPKVYL
jgi:hypothetical protein